MQANGIFEADNGLRVFVVGDVHYTSGENNEYNNPYIKMKNQHGIAPETKMQMFIDGILAEHKKKPVDAVLILGDIGNNDKPIQYFYYWYVRGKYYNPSTDSFEEGENRWKDWKEYLYDTFFQSEYDCIYQVKLRYLDQLTDNGIPYYVAPGNHDAYTDEMWRDCFGPVYDENGDLVEASHIGDNGKTEYVIEFPKKSAAFIMLDTNAYDETVDENGDVLPGPRFSYFLSHDNIAFSPIVKASDRMQWFENTIERLRGYRHLYIGGHYFDGADVVNGGIASDWKYLTTVGNKYGNLRLLMFGHSQSTYENWINGVLAPCVSHWAVGIAGGLYTEPETGKTRKMVWSIYHSPWGYSCIEADECSCEFYRISVACHYEWDRINGEYLEWVSLRQNPSLVAGDFDVLVPFKEPLDIPYRVWREYTLYPPEKVNTSPRNP